MSFQIWPMNISIVQLFILAIGVAISLALFNWLSRWWSKLIGMIVWIIVFIIFVIIAFFNISELWLLQFIAKLLRNNVFDSTKKFQNNFPRNDKVEINIKEAKAWVQTQKINYKLNKNYDSKKLDDIEKSSLI